MHRLTWQDVALGPEGPRQHHRAKRQHSGVEWHRVKLLAILYGQRQNVESVYIDGDATVGSEADATWNHIIIAAGELPNDENDSM